MFIPIPCSVVCVVVCVLPVRMSIKHKSSAGLLALHMEMTEALLLMLSFHYL